MKTDFGFFGGVLFVYFRVFFCFLFLRDNLLSENTEDNVPEELKTVRIYHEQKGNTHCPNQCQCSET